MGDLKQIRQRRILRVLISYNRTHFFGAAKGEGELGFEHDLIKAYEAYLNRGPKQERYQTHVVFLAHPFESLISELNAGHGDLIAAGLKITPETQALVSYTQPYLENINVILVSNKNQPTITRLEELSGKQIMVVSNSSHIIHLERFNQGLGQLGLEPMEIIQADPALESEDLLEMLDTGLIELTVADHHIAQVYQQTLNNLRVQNEMIFYHNGQIAWATNPNLPELNASLNEFIKHYARPGQTLHNTLYSKYFKNPFWIEKPINLSPLTQVECLQHYLQLYGTFYEFDWLLLAGLAYYESRFDMNAKSPAGAEGIMQILPTTAKSWAVNIEETHTLEGNIHAGVKYLAYLRDTFFSDPAYSPEDRVNFALAAYNAGPARIQSLQRKAEAQGLNRYKWFYHVEVLARKSIGNSTVNYVTQIQKTKIALQTAKSLFDDKQRAKSTQNPAAEPANQNTLNTQNP